MIKNISRLALMVAVMTPLSAFAAPGDEKITTKGYVDSGLIQKANKADIADMATKTWVTAQDYLTDADIAGVKTVTDAVTSNGTIAKANTALQTADLADYAKTVDVATAAQGAKADATDTALTTNGTIAKANSALQAADLDDYVELTDLGTAAFAATTDFATAAQGTKADATDTALTTNNTISKANTALQTADLDDYYTKTQSDTKFQVKHTCIAGQMLLTGANGAVSCVDVESGTYTE